MQRSSVGELVRVRAEDLEPGRRVRLDRRVGLSTVVSVVVDETDGRCLVDTDDGCYVCDPKALLDAEDSCEA